jgi:hypothetical protein
MALILGSCATGQPLLIGELDEIGWDRASDFQCYLSSRLTLTRLPDDSGAVNFSRDGSAFIQDTRGTVVLPASLEGRILDYHKRDQYLHVAFEEGDATLPFGRDRNGRFSLITTIDHGGAEYVEYAGSRYRPEFTALPYLRVVIVRNQTDLRRQMDGSRAGAAAVEDAAKLAGEKLIESLPEYAKLAVLNISSNENDRDTAALLVDELERHLVNSPKFTVVSRKDLDVLRSEQNFHISGDVSDESAVSLGNMSGASIVITGSLAGFAGARRLTLKALDVERAEILASLREDF